MTKANYRRQLIWVYGSKGRGPSQSQAWQLTGMVARAGSPQLQAQSGENDMEVGWEHKQLKPTPSDAPPPELQVFTSSPHSTSSWGLSSQILSSHENLHIQAVCSPGPGLEKRDRMPEEVESGHLGLRTPWPIYFLSAFWSLCMFVLHMLSMLYVYRWCTVCIVSCVCTIYVVYCMCL